MRVSSLSEQLLQAPNPDRRERLLARAAQSAECLVELLSIAEESLPGSVVQAIRAADLAIILAERREAWREGAQAWRFRARALRVLGQHAEALMAFAAAADYAERANDPLLAARVQVGRIDSLGWLGRYDEALELAGRLEARFLSLNAEHDAANVLINLGGLYFRRDRYAEALNCNRRALEIIRHQGNAIEIAEVEANCANLLTYLDQVEEAITLSERVQAEFA